VRELEQQGVRDQHEQEAEHKRERQAQRREHGRQNRVERGEHRGDQEGRARLLECHAREDRRRHPH
jgi:hypothetical protein